MSKKEYILFNVLLVALLFCLFIIAFVSNENTNLISCQMVKVTGQECSSCGLTRDFIAFTHLDFRSPINDQSIFVYLWFLFHLIIRSILILRPKCINPNLMKWDLMISLLTGIVVFLPFWISESF